MRIIEVLGEMQQAQKWLKASSMAILLTRGSRALYVCLRNSASEFYPLPVDLKRYPPGGKSCEGHF
jgi:hypothetical protein